MLKIYLHTKNEVSRLVLQELEPAHDRQTDTYTDATERITMPHSRIVRTVRILTKMRIIDAALIWGGQSVLFFE